MELSLSPGHQLGPAVYSARPPIFGEGRHLFFFSGRVPPPPAPNSFLGGFRVISSVSRYYECYVKVSSYADACSATYASLTSLFPSLRTFPSALIFGTTFQEFYLIRCVPPAKTRFGAVHLFFFPSTPSTSPSIRKKALAHLSAGHFNEWPLAVSLPPPFTFRRLFVYLH